MGNLKAIKLRELLREAESEQEVDLEKLIKSKLPDLEKLIKSKTGINCKLRLDAGGGYYEIQSDNLVKEFGAGGKSLFVEIFIIMTSSKNPDPGKEIWFQANFKYQHPYGGSNGHQLNKDSAIWFNPLKQEWIWR